MASWMSVGTSSYLPLHTAHTVLVQSDPWRKDSNDEEEILTREIKGKPLYWVVLPSPFPSTAMALQENKHRAASRAIHTTA